MKLAISSKVMGTDRHLLCDGDSFSWISIIPDNIWSLGDDDRSRDLSAVALALDKSLTLFDTESQRNMWQTLRKDSDRSYVPWAYSISCDQFKNHIFRIKRSAYKIIDEISGSYYDDVFVENRKLLTDLKRAKVNKSRLQNIDDLHSSLFKFRPKIDGLIQQIRYDQSKSTTGRLTVKSGPNILTLKKENRSIFSSRFHDGRLLQVDFVSLEPRIALDVAGIAAPNDIYDDISKNIFDGKISRDISKISTICCLYGMTSKNLSLKLPPDNDADMILSSIKSYFKIRNLERGLKSFYDQNGFIENLYGRKILSDSSHVNHYLQSTGVDASLLGFRYLLERCKNMNVNLLPVFVIHDAMIIDAPEKSVAKIEKIASEGVKIRGISQKFPVKIENFV